MKFLFFGNTICFYDSIFYLSSIFILDKLKYINEGSIAINSILYIFYIYIFNILRILSNRVATTNSHELQSVQSRSTYRIFWKMYFHRNDRITNSNPKIASAGCRIVYWIPNPCDYTIILLSQQKGDELIDIYIYILLLYLFHIGQKVHSALLRLEAFPIIIPTLRHSVVFR